MFNSDQERFWEKVDVRGLYECWPWTACILANGYGQFYLGRLKGAHCAAFELTYGAIPQGLEVDHTCLNRACCNPFHLRAITHKQNTENRLLSSTNTTGVRGVTFVRGRFEARVRHHGKRFYLGRFDTLGEARDAVVAKRNELYTHNDLDRISV